MATNPRAPEPIPLIVPIAFGGPLDAVMPRGAHVQALITPTHGYDCYVLAQRIEPGAEGLPLHTHAVDQYFYVVDGEMSIQLGSDSFVACAGTLVHVPPGTPHRSWNVGVVDERHLEVIVPGPPMAELSSPAAPAQIPETSRMLRLLERGQAYRDIHVDIELFDWPAGEPRSLGTASKDRIIILLQGALGSLDRAAADASKAPSLLAVRQGESPSVVNAGAAAAICLSVHLSPAK
jgi:mannose-6-phosphate isomerase-like protein (cupin superfamily)